jgi:hypothetical protein
MKNVLLSIFVFSTLFFVAGCASTKKEVVVSTKNVVITPDAGLYNCPMIQEFPDWKTLDDRQVAETIVKMYKNNVACFNSNEAIRKFLEDAKKKVAE